MDLIIKTQITCLNYKIENEIKSWILYRRYLSIPCIIRFIGLLRANIINPATNGMMVKIRKNPEKPKSSAIESEYSAIIDANLPDKPINRYQIPNMNPNILAGANLLT